MTQQERALIDRYIDNSLSGVELKDFMDRLENDENFRKTVVLQNLLVESIQKADDSRIEKEIISSINYRKPRIPSGLKLILIFLVITTVGITLWEYIGTGTSMRKRKLFSFEMFKKKVENSDKDKPLIKKESSQAIDDSSVGEESSPTEEAVTPNVENNSSADSLSAENLSQDENVEVKKDQLLVSHVLKANEIGNEEKKQDPSLSQSTTTKLNPAAGLVENAKSEEYEVEFWVSPVNYKGYKLNSNKLILFGIEEPDAVKLYSIDSKLVMKYGQEFYRLHSTSDFISFSAVRSTEFPASLK